MRLLILYHQTAPRHVMYLRRLAINMATSNHWLYGPQSSDYVMHRPIEDVIRVRRPIDGILAMEPKFLKWMPPLRDLKIPKAIILSDYYPCKRAWQETNQRLDMDRYDLIFAQTLFEIEALKKNGRPEKVVYLPMSVDTTYFQNRGLNRDVDIMASWGMNRHAYPERQAVMDLLLSMDRRSFLGQIFWDEYVEMLNRAKIFVNSGPIYRNIQSRFTEVLACGCMLMTDNVTDLGEQGFFDGTNLVLYDDTADLERKIIHYLSDEPERIRIAKAGYDHVRKFHSNEVRIKEITASMESL